MAYKFALLDPRPIPAAEKNNEEIFSSQCGICSHSSGQLDGETCRDCGGTGRRDVDVLGIEVTVPSLAARCSLGNIDPQHGFFSAGPAVPSSSEEEELWANLGSAESAIEAAWNWPLPVDGAILATVRADLDAVGAMAVADLRASGGFTGFDDSPNVWTGINGRILSITTADKFARGGWPGPQSLPTKDNPWPEKAGVTGQLAAIAAAIGDFNMPLDYRVEWMKNWLLTGEEPRDFHNYKSSSGKRGSYRCSDCGQGQPISDDPNSGDAHLDKPTCPRYRLRVERERADLIRALESGEIRREVLGESTQLEGLVPLGAGMEPGVDYVDNSRRLAVVETTHRAATMIGYSFSPIVIALNPAFRVGGGEPHRKFTVCQFAGGYVDLKAAATELAQLEPGWGGSPTIIGSPQGQGSTLSTEQVLDVVARHLK